MARMYNKNDLEEAIRRTAPGDPPRPDFADWREKYPDVLGVFESCVGTRANHDRSIASVIRFGRNAMKRRRVRFGAVAAAVLLTVVFLGRGTDKAWSVEQTLAAMKNIEAVHITGKNLCGGEVVDFECWVACPGAGEDALRMRHECSCARKTTLVVRGGTVYAYSPVENVVRIRDGSKIEDLQFWYEGAKLSPWLTGKMLETLRLIGHGWEQTVETDPDTGQTRIVVRCSHPPSSISFRLVVNAETKLIEKAELWRNLEWKGPPTIDARVFAYNPDIPDGLFEFESPAGATVITEKDEAESEALLERAEQLFHEDEKYAKALRVYQEVYDQYPHYGTGSSALMMIGICHGYLGDHEKAIAAFQKALREYPTGWEGVLQFYLGSAYMDNGQSQEALKAFEECLKDAEGIRAADQFPVKEAREYIAHIEAQ